MKRIMMILLLTAALLFSGCSVPQTGKGKKSESENAVETTGIGIKDKDGQTVPLSETVLYDRCGVKVTSSGMNGSSPVLTVNNGSDKRVRLVSSYVEADGILRSDIRIASDIILPGGKTNITVESLDGVCSLRTRLLLEDENYYAVGGSISDPIELTLSGKLYLPSKELYSLLYEDDRVLLGLCRVSYRDDSNRVTLNMYAQNKTDSDFCLSATDIECVHKDYYAMMSAVIPAGSNGNITMRVSTRNATLSPADLDSISLALRLSSLEDYYGLSEDSTYDCTEKFSFRLPVSGRPEVVIPDTIESTVTPEEYIAEVTSSDDLTPLQLAGDHDLLYEDENVLAELVLAAVGTKSSGAE